MKQSLLALLLLVTSVAFAQSKKEKQVTNAVEQLRLAMISGDRASLEKLVLPQLSYGHSGGHIDDKETFVKKLAEGSSDFVTINLTEQTISVTGKTAIVRHLLQATTNDGGKPGEVKLRVMLVWYHTHGAWKLLARQAVKVT